MRRLLLGRDRAGAKPVRKARLGVESLESRLVLYTATGNLWPAPQLVTISFMPDGTNINGYSNNLNATFNARFGSAATWQNVFLKAAQSWAAQTNINFAVVSDNGAAAGSGSNQQGDPGFGDIRIGGYNFGTTALAMASAPPPANNYSIAGDFTFNTGKVFAIGSGNDLFTIAAHELGHALGLGHSATSTAAMYSTYNGVKASLAADDIAGIRAIYSAGAARAADANDAASKGASFTTAVSLTESINPTTKTALAAGLDITTTSDVDYYTFTAPAGTSSTAKVVVQSTGLSLLAPNLTVYASDKATVLATVSGLGKYGTTLTATLTGVTAGQVYYVKVAGADATVLGTGKYALALNFGNNATPAETVSTVMESGASMVSGGGIATRINVETEVDSYAAATQTDPNNLRAIGVDSFGNSVVVWQSLGQDGGGWGVYAQRFDKNGNKVGGEFPVNTTTAGDQAGAAVAVGPLGNFIVTWSGQNQDGGGLGVFAQRFDSKGNKVGGEIQVNTTTSGDQTGAVPVIDVLGNVVVTWSSQGQDGGGWGVYAQRFDLWGKKVGGEVQVNTTTSGDQSNATIGINKLTSEFVVAWSSAKQDGSGLGVYAQRFDSKGNKVGGEFRVNTTTKGDQTAPSVAMDGDGDFVVAWRSSGQEDGLGVYAQRFDSDGDKVDGEFRVNTFTKGDQKSPSVTMDIVGNFVITWVSYGQASPGGVVYSRQFFHSGAPVDAEVQVSTSIANGDQLYPSATVDSFGHFAVVWTYPRADSSGQLTGGVFMQAFGTTLLAEQSGEPADAFEPLPTSLPATIATEVEAPAPVVEVPPVALERGRGDATRSNGHRTSHGTRPRNRLVEWAGVRPKARAQARAGSGSGSGSGSEGPTASPIATGDPFDRAMLT